jgi:hypothetical protein
MHTTYELNFPRIFVWKVTASRVLVTRYVDVLTETIPLNRLHAYAVTVEFTNDEQPRCVLWLSAESYELLTRLRPGARQHAEALHSLETRTELE